MFRKSTRPARCFSLVTASCLAISAPVSAQAEENPSEENENSEADKPSELEKLTSAVQALVDVQGEQENQITGEDSTGQFETDVLALRALSKLVSNIQHTICKKEEKKEENACDGKRILVLAHSEDFGFGLYSRITSQANAFGQQIEAADGFRFISQANAVGVAEAEFVPVTELIGAFSAVSSLMRNERTLKNLSSTAIDDEMLALALAASLKAKGADSRVIAGSPGVRLDINMNDEPDWDSQSGLALKIAWLLAYDSTLSPIANLTEEEKKWKSQFKIFYDAISEERNGKNPILADAIESNTLEAGLDGVIKVKLGSKGGTRTTSKNFGTTVLGLDPFRVTGGLTATFTYFSARANERSSPLMWGAITCTSDDMRLDDVRSANFASGKDAMCTAVESFGSI